MPSIEQSDAVRTDECTAVLLAGGENLLLEHGTFVGFLAKTGRYNNERANTLLFREKFDVLRTEFRRHDQNREFGRRKVLHVLKRLDALNLVFLRVDDAQFALESATQQVSHDSTAGLLNIVRATDDDDAFRF